MQTVRRLYVYLLSGVGLGVSAYGLTTLLSVLLAQVGMGHGAFGVEDGPFQTQQELSLAAALIGVGVPVWSIHWWLAQRGLRPDRSGAELERASTVRALYLTLVLVTLLGFGALAARDLLRELVLDLMPATSGQYGGSDTAMALATLLVSAVAWGYHVTVRRRDMALGAVRGAAAWLPRVYVYGATLAALVLTLQTAGDLTRYMAEAIWPQAPSFDDSGYRSYVLADQASSLAVWTIGWAGHWWYAGRLLGSSGWRAAAERVARLRIAFFVAVILAGSLSVLRLLAEAGRALLLPLGGDAVGGSADDIVRSVAVTLASAVPWAVVWWLHQRRLDDEALQADEASRVALASRLRLHAPALVGLAFAASGGAMLIGLLISTTLGGTRTSGGDAYWQFELAGDLPPAVLGLALWLWRWVPIQRRRAARPDEEGSSTVRRAFLVITVAGGVIAGVASLAFVLYRLFGSLFGANLGGDAVAELSTPLGVLAVATAVVAYHGLVVRRDLALHPGDGAIPTGDAGPTRRATSRELVLQGPAGGDIEAAIGSLRETLPPGFSLEER